MVEASFLCFVAFPDLLLNHREMREVHEVVLRKCFIVDFALSSVKTKFLFVCDD